MRIYVPSKSRMNARYTKRTRATRMSKASLNGHPLLTISSNALMIFSRSLLPFVERRKSGRP